MKKLILIALLVPLLLGFDNQTQELIQYRTYEVKYTIDGETKTQSVYTFHEMGENDTIKDFKRMMVCDYLIENDKYPEIKVSDWIFIRQGK